MRFSVITADESETFYDGDYRIEDNGVLKIVPDDDGAKQLQISPAFWQAIKSEKFKPASTVF